MQYIQDPSGQQQPPAQQGFEPPPAQQGFAFQHQDPGGHGAGESAELFDWVLIASYALFILRSIKRHKLLFISVWGGIVAFSPGLILSLPKTYQVQTTLQAQRSQSMPGLSARPNMDPEAPTRLALETVQRYDNLVALIQQTKLLKNWQRHRAPLPRLKTFIWRKLFKPPTPEEELDNFVYYLRDKLWVKTGDGTVTIGIEFPDAELAYRLVDTALQNFLEARHAADVSSIAEAITILEARTDHAHQALASALQTLQTLREARAGRTGKQVRKSTVLRGPAPMDQET